ncbi:(2Fe-2S)-binding protein [Kineosporia sp. J2-2]|uniref:(2Fe-2S)-binding protein n=1 Tax=Kineosporia corallincola TaxID=2835133 RepID=A0ABS5TG26_9ACTN|nr:(2Fe-2S)-binding protein [Kineosporia corallincola]MBT0770047.1 (2Fe-2S)-binding protein [Kineosporia corallincola]
MNDDDVVVCVCADVGEDEITRLVRCGHRTVEDLRRVSGANSRCGSCRDDIEELIAQETTAHPAVPSPVA